MPQPTGVAPIAGTSGRFKSVLLAMPTDTDLPYTSATFLAAFNSATTVVGNEIDEWSIENSVESGKFTSFESPTDGQRVLHPRLMAGGISRGVTARVKGSVNIGSSGTTEARFPKGAYIKFDLIIHKGSTAGHYDCLGKIASHNKAAKHDDPNPQKFDLNIDLDGTLPALTFPA